MAVVIDYRQGTTYIDEGNLYKTDLFSDSEWAELKKLQKEEFV